MTTRLDNVMTTHQCMAIGQKKMWYNHCVCSIDDGDTRFIDNSGWTMIGVVVQ